ncbi:hypothetical protein HUN08_12320 [Gordonia sp. X0973]|uniref:hypothetical protein n=1 Tax=Gordonia sp. X0973 TaxID=2742602 RepID=UPI000F53F023|nr:hypothetical protein [Gordonia sp. X0973]QKT07880.1 hypothetical protein HUN08_12320 [Gordonia sp. X0973]
MKEEDLVIEQLRAAADIHEQAVTWGAFGDRDSAWAAFATAISTAFAGALNEVAYEIRKNTNVGLMK